MAADLTWVEVIEPGRLEDVASAAQRLKKNHACCRADELAADAKALADALERLVDALVARRN